jgi:pimeloyl-ACP methyl ester carboxylesterase
VLRFARFSILFTTLATFVAIPLWAADGAAVGARQDGPSSIVVGFVGGFVRHDNPYQGPVLLGKSLQRNAPKGTYVRVFENRRRKAAYRTIVQLLDRDHDGTLSDEEKAQARIVLYGHSWGAAAAVLLARDLRRLGIPVLLTVQVDSVAKFWQHDGIIPENVAAAVNFYQTHGIIHGRAEITAADPAKTQILGNYRFDYKQEPVKCEGLSWSDRLFTPTHAQSDCDPHLWTQVENLVRQRLEPVAGIAAVNPRP